MTTAVALQPITRGFAWLLAIAIGIHALILAYGLQAAFGEVRADYSVDEFAGVALVCLIVFGGLIAWQPRRIPAISAVSITLLAAALLTPAAVLTVVLMLLGTYLIGERMLEWAGPTRIAAAMDESVKFAAVPLLVGLGLSVGAMAMTAALKIHYTAVYAVILLLPIVLWWRRGAAIASATVAVLARSHAAPRITERCWIVLLLTFVAIHLFIVAKPDASSDGGTVHWQFALLLAQYHRWTFDVTRYVWAVMPLGADHAFAAANMLGGESAARLQNLVFGAIAAQFVYGLSREYAGREIALALVVLLVSTPLAFLVAGSFFSETLQLAFLMGALYLTLGYVRSRSPAAFAALAWAAAGALQSKLTSIVWLTPLLAYACYLAWRSRRANPLNRTAWALVIAAAIVAAWPYANAWARTGNPVFPFLNALFHSPFFETSTSFTNPLYNTPLQPWRVYEMLFSSGRYIEGTGGAAGWQWLLLLPVVFLSFLRRQPVTRWLCLGLLVIFFVAIFIQQAYIRYLLPAFALFTVLGAWALADLPDGQRKRAAILVIGFALCALNLRFIYAGSWPNAALCLRCSMDAKARRDYLGLYDPDRIVADYLNASVPRGRVGFFMPDMVSPAGYTGYSRSNNWHDHATFAAMATAQSAEDILAIARRNLLTHAVVPAPSTDEGPSAMNAFRDKYTVPIWQFRGRAVARIKLPSE
jgi:4-amino-4-deoxy-L-arabinose transferase-like glycosyltransferase